MAIRKALRLAIEKKRARMTWCGFGRLFISSSSEASVLTIRVIAGSNDLSTRLLEDPAGKWLNAGGSLTLQQASQPPVTGATDRQPCTVIQDGNMAVFGVGLQLHNALQVHKIRTMNAQEVLRIE